MSSSLQGTFQHKLKLVSQTICMKYVACLPILPFERKSMIAMRINASIKFSLCRTGETKSEPKIQKRSMFLKAVHINLMLAGRPYEICIRFFLVWLLLLYETNPDLFFIILLFIVFFSSYRNFPFVNVPVLCKVKSSISTRWNSR